MSNAYIPLESIDLSILIGNITGGQVEGFPEATDHTLAYLYLVKHYHGSSVWANPGLYCSPDCTVGTQESSRPQSDPTSHGIARREENTQPPGSRKRRYGYMGEKNDEISVRRRNQNREAQRAYRQRKIRKAEELERQLFQATQRINELMSENQAAKLSSQLLTAQNRQLRKLVAQLFRSHLVQGAQFADAAEGSINTSSAPITIAQLGGNSCLQTPWYGSTNSLDATV